MFGAPSAWRETKRPCHGALDMRSVWCGRGVEGTRRAERPGEGSDTRSTGTGVWRGQGGSGPGVDGSRGAEACAGASGLGSRLGCRGGVSGAAGRSLRGEGGRGCVKCRPVGSQGPSLLMSDVKASPHSVSRAASWVKPGVIPARVQPALASLWNRRNSRKKSPAHLHFVHYLSALVIMQ